MPTSRIVSANCVSLSAAEQPLLPVLGLTPPGPVRHSLPPGFPASVGYPYCLPVGHRRAGPALEVGQVMLRGNASIALVLRLNITGYGSVCPVSLSKSSATTAVVFPPREDARSPICVEQKRSGLRNRIILGLPPRPAWPRGTLSVIRVLLPIGAVSSRPANTLGPSSPGKGSLFESCVRSPVLMAPLPLRAVPVPQPRRHRSLVTKHVLPFFRRYRPTLFPVTGWRNEPSCPIHRHSMGRSLVFTVSHRYRSLAITLSRRGAKQHASRLVSQPALRCGCCLLAILIAAACLVLPTSTFVVPRCEFTCFPYRAETGPPLPLPRIAGRVDVFTARVVTYLSLPSIA